MVIKNYKKLRNGQYELTLETQKVILHEDLILKHQLLLKHEVTDNLLEELLLENQSYQAYEIALKSLNSRQKTYLELYDILKKNDFAKDIIHVSLNRLQNQGYINHTVYAESYLHDKMAMSYDGPNKINQDLCKKGIEESIVLKVLSNFTKAEQEERVQKLIEKEIKINHNRSKRLLFQKIQIRLQQLGYDRDIVNIKLSKYEVDDGDIRKKEYEKLYKKLSRKYQGLELELKIKQKMYLKGFSTNEQST